MSELKERRRTLNFTGHEDYEVFEDSLQLEGLSPGVYLLEFSTQPQTEVSRMLYYVSGLRLMTEAQPDNSIRYVVVDVTTANRSVRPLCAISSAGGRSPYRPRS